MITILVVLSLLLFAFNFFGQFSKSQKVSITDFLNLLRQNNIREVVVEEEHLTFTTNSNQKSRTVIPFYYKKKLQEILTASGVSFKYTPEASNNIFLILLGNWFPVLLIIGVWFFIFRQLQGGNKMLNVGQTVIQQIDKDKLDITFANVAGIEEVKEEVFDIVEFLRDPQKFLRMGAKVPRGVLLLGAPGTGKTLLAKAVAGEAQATFFTVSGSDFVEMFVGVGSSRVRGLFKKARENKPAIIFIDEIDSIGRQRGSGLGGGNDEREQTLNQLLVEMDGFSDEEGVIVIAATNRASVLDNALTRPGRFDRKIVVPLPNFVERKQILAIHTKDLKLAKKVDLTSIAQATIGMAGAHLANLANEAALLAGRKKKKQIEQIDFEMALEKIAMGPERKSLKMEKEEKEITAIHEAGHALVAIANNQKDILHKVTIVPHAQALGVTMFLPNEEGDYITHKDLYHSLEMIMGGRAAEDIVFQEISTGASNDFERASETAYRMICNWGMSKIGPIHLTEDNQDIFLGRQILRKKVMGEKIAQAVDQEVQNLLNKVYNNAKKILKENIQSLHKIAEKLMKEETISGKQVIAIFKANQPVKS
jgi:cell division protease FtsH